METSTLIAKKTDLTMAEIVQRLFQDRTVHPTDNSARPLVRE